MVGRLEGRKVGWKVGRLEGWLKGGSQQRKPPVISNLNKDLKMTRKTVLNVLLLPNNNYWANYYWAIITRFKGVLKVFNRT